MTTAPTHAPYAYRRATRDTEAPIIGGVAAGLARHLGLPSLWVRVAFVLATALSGLGVALYAGWWLLLPADTAFERSTPGAESATRVKSCILDDRTSNPKRIGPATAMTMMPLVMRHGL